MSLAAHPLAALATTAGRLKDTRTLQARLRHVQLPVAFSALIIAYCIYCYWPVIHADWFIIDDHEVIDKIGTANHLPFRQIIKELHGTEVDLSSTWTRYRLLYFPLQLLESAVYGKNVTLWYIERVAIACLMGVTLYAMARDWLGLYVGFVFAIFELSRPYWGPGMFTRLGSGETYGVFGLSLIAIAFCIDGHRMTSRRSCALLALGLIVCVGTKENFLPFILLPIAALFYNRRSLSIVSKLILSTSILFTLWSGAVIAYRLKRAAHDVYMHEATLSGRSRLLLDFLQLPSVRIWILAIAVAGGWWLFRISKLRLADSVSKRLGFSLIINLISLAFYLTQFVFYNGDWPNEDVPRYLFPGLLIRDFSEILLLVAFIDSLPSNDWLRWWPRDATRDFMPIKGLAKVALIAALAWTSAMRFSDNRHFAVTMATDSSRFMDLIRQAVKDLATRGDAALVITGHSVGDFEPVYSISKFFRAFGGTNPIMFELDEASARKSVSFGGRMDQELIDGLKKTEAVGSGYIEPFSKDRLGDCFSIGLSGPKSPNCTRGVGYQVPWEG